MESEKMRKTVGFLAGVTLAFSLGGYGVKTYAQQRVAAPTGGEGVLIQGSSSQITQEQIQANEARVSAMKKKEIRIVNSLGLSKTQMQKYQAALKQQDQKNAALYRMKSGHIEEGMKMNKWWNDTLKSIFTKEQYSRYVALWSSSDATVAPRRNLMEGKEEEIWEKINLSEAQKRQIVAHHVMLDQLMAERAAAIKQGDPDALLAKDAKIIQKNRAGIKAILTAEQHAKYMAHWNEVMRPMVKNTQPGLRARIILNGKASKGTLRALTEEDLKLN